MQIWVHDDVRIDTRIYGSGDDAVVLVHGFPLSKAIWDEQIPALAQTHRVISIDLRGMGDSSVPDGPYLMETLAGDVAAVLDHLAVERATIVGHSLGGYVALAFARMYGERVSRLALVCSRIIADTPERAKSRFESAERLEKFGVDQATIEQSADALFLAENREKSAKIVEKAREILRKSDPRGLAAMLRGMALRDSSQDIAPELAMPVLVAASRRDPVVPWAESEAMVRSFPSARLVAFEGSGHAPMLEEPAALAAALTAFTGG